MVLHRRDGAGAMPLVAPGSLKAGAVSWHSNRSAWTQHAPTLHCRRCANISLARTEVFRSPKPSGQKPASAWRFIPAQRSLHRIQLRRIRQKEGQPDAAVDRIDAVTHQQAAVCPQPVPYDQRAPLDMSSQCAGELDDLWQQIRPIAQPERTAGKGQSGDHRQLLPVRMLLRARLIVRNSVPKTDARGPATTVRRSSSCCPASSGAGRPPLRIERRASKPSALSTSSQRYTARRGAPTAAIIAFREVPIQGNAIYEWILRYYAMFVR